MNVTNTWSLTAVISNCHSNSLGPGSVVRRKSKKTRWNSKNRRAKWAEWGTGRVKGRRHLYTSPDYGLARLARRFLRRPRRFLFRFYSHCGAWSQATSKIYILEMFLINTFHLLCLNDFILSYRVLGEYYHNTALIRSAWGMNTIGEYFIYTVLTFSFIARFKSGIFRLATRSEPYWQSWTFWSERRGNLRPAQFWRKINLIRVIWYLQEIQTVWAGFW